MLDPRATHLLKALIDLYIAEGQPVGSRILSRQSGLDLSPASIRNIMADLEDMGFIESPHTSAGRVPTPRGYRFFVDSLMVIEPMARQEIERLQVEITSDARPQQIVANAATLLSRLSRFAGIVLTPKRKEVLFRHWEFLRLSDERVLLIVVSPEGDVQNRVLETRHRFSDEELAAAAQLFNTRFVGLPISSIRERLARELKSLREDIATLMTSAIDVSEKAMTKTEAVIVGESNLLNSEDLTEKMERLRHLFGAFEQKTSLIHLLDAAQNANGMQIYIGSESGVTPLDECSVITAPYQVNGELLGTVGVIGPTRMAYDRVIPIVDVTAQLLSRALSQSPTVNPKK